MAMVNPFTLAVSSVHMKQVPPTAPSQFTFSGNTHASETGNSIVGESQNSLVVQILAFGPKSVWQIAYMAIIPGPPLVVPLEYPAKP